MWLLFNPSLTESKQRQFVTLMNMREWIVFYSLFKASLPGWNKWLQVSSNQGVNTLKNYKPRITTACHAMISPENETYLYICLLKFSRVMHSVNFVHGTRVIRQLLYRRRTSAFFVYNIIKPHTEPIRMSIGTIFFPSQSQSYNLQPFLFEHASGFNIDWKSFMAHTMAWRMQSKKNHILHFDGGSGPIGSNIWELIISEGMDGG